MSPRSQSKQAETWDNKRWKRGAGLTSRLSPDPPKQLSRTRTTPQSWAEPGAAGWMPPPPPLHRREPRKAAPGKEPGSRGRL